MKHCHLERTGTKQRGNAENRAGLMKLTWRNTGGKQHQEQGGDKELKHCRCGGKQKLRKKHRNARTQTGNRTNTQSTNTIRQNLQDHDNINLEM